MKRLGGKSDGSPNASKYLFLLLFSFLISSTGIWVILLQPQSIDQYLEANMDSLRDMWKTNESTHLLSYQQSFGFFDDIPDESWQRMQQRARTLSRYRNVTHPQDGHEKAGWWYAHNLHPNFNCFNMERVGGLDDGPKWTCDPYRLLKRPDCLIYSIGSAGQYQWERGLVQRLGSHCEIHVFDPGNYSRVDLPPNVHYHQWGLKSSYDMDYQPSLYKQIQPDEMLTFAETLRRLGHENRVIDIFKLDCEKCEWSSYKDWIGANIRQLIVEVHGVPSPYGPNEWHHSGLNVSDFYNAFEQHGFAMYFKEPNVYSRGNCVEFGYIKLRSDFWSDD